MLWYLVNSRWFDNLENKERGRDYAINVAKELSQLDLYDVLECTEEGIKYF